jgi:hypothetical protein
MPEQTTICRDEGMTAPRNEADDGEEDVPEVDERIRLTSCSE